MKPRKTHKTTRRPLVRTAPRPGVGLAGALLGSAVLGVFSAHADEFWVGDTSPDWNTAANWSGDSFPVAQWTVINSGSPHSAVISANSAFTPTDLGVGRGAGQTGRLDHVAGTVQSGVGNWTWVGMEGGNGTYNLANTSGTGGALTGFATGSGTMDARSTLQIGSAGGTGVVNINTTGALNVSGDLRIVDHISGGTGTLNVDAGTVSVGNHIQLAKLPGGTGTIRIGGGAVSGRELRVGYGGATGTVNLSGGSLTTDGWTTFGGGNSTGNLNVSGGTFTVIKDALIIGDNGASTFAQAGGNVVVNGQMFVGQGTGTGTQNLSLGTFTTTNWSVVGREGAKGTVNMTGGTWNHNAGGGTHVVIATSQNSSIGTVNLSGGLMNVQSAAVEVGEWGNGTLDLSNTAELRSGEIRVGLNLGAVGTLNLNGGTLRTRRISGNNRQGTAGAGVSNVNFNGTQIIASASEPAFITNLDTAVIQAGGLNIDSNGFTMTGNQPLGGGGGVVKSGAGTLTLLGAHSYSGSNLVQAGSLMLPNAATGTGAIQVNAGASLGIRETVYNSRISPASLTFAAASSLDIAFTDPSGLIQTIAPLNVTGNLALGGDLSINVTDVQSEIGSVPLIAYGTKSGAGVAVLGSLPENVSGTLQDNGSLISLNVTSIAPLTWDGDTGAWNLTAANWYDEEGFADDVTFTNGRWVNFDDLFTGTPDVVLNGLTVSPAGTLFENSVFNYTLNGTGSIGGNGRLIKRGTASVAINTANTYTGLTRIEAGTLSVSTLANGGVASSIGQSSSAPENLALAGGTLYHTGASATSDRGFMTTAALSGIGTDNHLTLTGPARSDNGNFVKSGPGTLTLAHNGPNAFGGGGLVDGINVRGGTLVFDGSSGSQTNNVTGDIWVGTDTATGGNLSLTNTVLNSAGNYLAVARGNGSTGLTSTVTLTNSTLATGNLSLAYGNNLPGYNAAAVLTLNNSSYTLTGINRLGESSGGSGMVTLNGASTMTTGPTNIGDNGGSTGNLNIKGTSLYTSNNRVHVGSGAGSTGNLVIEGSGRLVVNDFISIGFNGGGSMTVKDSGSFTNVGDFSINESGDVPTFVTLQDNGSISVGQTVYVGRNAGRVGTLTQTGGNFTNAGNEFQIGRDGQGSWLQSGGITNAAGWVSIGRFGPGTGILTVSGTGTFTQTGTDRGLMVGEAGTGTLNLQGGGTVSSRGTVGVLVSNGATGVGTVNLDGGTLAALNVRDGGGSSTFHFNGGTLKANPGAALNFMSGIDTVTVKSGGATVDSNGQMIAINQNLVDGSGGGGLTKTGAGFLQLNGNNSFTGTTTVAAGSLGGTGAVAGPLFVGAAGTLAPGAAVGTFTSGNASIAGTYAVEVNGAASDRLTVNGDLNLGGAKIVVSATGATGTEWTIATYSGTLGGTVASVTPGYAINTATPGVVKLVVASGTPFDAWAQDHITAINPNADSTAGGDPDKDGITNLVEFALNGNPLAGDPNGKLRSKVASVGGNPSLVLTLPVRGGATFSGATQKVSSLTDGLIYTIQGSDQLVTWDLVVSEVLGADKAAIETGLPALGSGWEYRTFQSPGTVTGDPQDFLRAAITQP